MAFLGVPFVEFYGVFSYSPEVGVCCFSPRYCTSAILQICESTAEVARFYKKVGGMQLWILKLRTAEKLRVCSCDNISLKVANWPMRIPSSCLIVIADIKKNACTNLRQSHCNELA